MKLLFSIILSLFSISLFSQNIEYTYSRDIYNQVDNSKTKVFDLSGGKVYYEATVPLDTLLYLESLDETPILNAGDGYYYTTNQQLRYAEPNYYVRTWYDQSKYERNATQTSATYQPLFDTVGSSYFDGSNDRLIFTPFEIGTTFTIDLSFNPDTTVNKEQRMISGYSFGKYNDFVSIGLSRDYEQFRIYGKDVAINGSGIILNNNQIYRLVLTRLENKLHLYEYDIDNKVYYINQTITQYPDSSFYLSMIGGYGSGSYMYKGIINSLKIYDNKICDLTDFITKFGNYYVSGNGINLVFEGDSRVADVDDEYICYPETIADSLEFNATDSLFNYAVGGRITSQILQYARQHVTLSYDSTKTNVCIIDVGINDIIRGKDMDSAVNNIMETAAVYNLKGFKVYVCTVYPAQSTVYGSGDAYFLRCWNDLLYYNSKIRSNAILYGYKVIDTFSDSAFNYYDAPNDETYYSDKIHLRESGRIYLGNIIYQAITTP